MATKSAVTALANEDAGIVNQDAIATKAKVAAIAFTIEKLADNTDGDQIQIAKVHSDWSVLSIKLDNDALTGATGVDIGLWSDAPPAEAVAIDDDCYASAISLASALDWAEQGFEARDLSAVGQKVWQDAGLTERPSGGAWYRMALQLDTGGAATGTISGIIEVALPS